MSVSVFASVYILMCGIWTSPAFLSYEFYGMRHRNPRTLCSYTMRGSARTFVFAFSMHNHRHADTKSAADDYLLTEKRYLLERIGPAGIHLARQFRRGGLA